MIAKYPETTKLAEIMYHMGVCYTNLGQFEKAEQTFNDLVKEFPEKPWIGYTRDRLKEFPGNENSAD